MAGQLRVDEITDEAGTGSPSFPNGVSIPNGVTINNWSVIQSGTDLVFRFNGTAVFRITSAGAVVAANNVTAYGVV